MGKASGNGKCCKGLKMTKVLVETCKDCADVCCVTLNELQAHRDAFIQKTGQS